MSRDKCGRFVATRRMGLSRQPDRSWEDGQASKRHAASWDSWGSPQVLLFCGLISYFFPQKNNLSFPAEPEKKLTSSLDPKVVSAEHQFASWLEKIIFWFIFKKKGSYLEA